MSLKPRLTDITTPLEGVVNNAKRVDEFAALPDNLVNHTKHEEQPKQLKGTEKPC